jgi:sarcosine oxidase
VEQVAVAVIGAGVLGSATARALAARGVDTVLLEQFGPGHTRGSSHGATRIFRLSYPDPAYVRMAMAASAAWAALQADAGERLLVVTGGLDAGPAARKCAAALAECGVPHSWLSLHDLAGRFPGIAAGPGERMLFQPDAGVCLADRTVAALQRLAAREGVALQPHTPVLRIDNRGSHVVLHTPSATIRAGTAVITAGPWMTGLLAGVLEHVPHATPTLQQIRYYRPARADKEWPTLIDWQADGGAWYLVPQAGGAPGLKVATHVPGRGIDPDRGPFPPTPAQDDMADRYVRRRLPGLRGFGLAPQTCLYTMTADEDFVLDRAGPVVVGGGCSGHAFKFGPLLGEVLARLALGEDAGLPPGRFSLTRPALAAPAVRP